MDKLDHACICNIAAFQPDVRALCAFSATCKTVLQSLYSREADEMIWRKLALLDYPSMGWHVASTSMESAKTSDTLFKSNANGTVSDPNAAHASPQWVKLSRPFGKEFCLKLDAVASAATSLPSPGPVLRALLTRATQAALVLRMVRWAAAETAAGAVARESILADASWDMVGALQRAAVQCRATGEYGAAQWATQVSAKHTAAAVGMEIADFEETIGHDGMALTCPFEGVLLLEGADRALRQPWGDNMLAYWHAVQEDLRHWTLELRQRLFAAGCYFTCSFFPPMAAAADLTSMAGGRADADTQLTLPAHALKHGLSPFTSDMVHLTDPGLNMKRGLIGRAALPQACEHLFCVADEAAAGSGPLAQLLNTEVQQNGIKTAFLTHIGTAAGIAGLRMSVLTPTSLFCGHNQHTATLQLRASLQGLGAAVVLPPLAVDHSDHHVEQLTPGGNIRSAAEVRGVLRRLKEARPDAVTAQQIELSAVCLPLISLVGCHLGARPDVWPKATSEMPGGVAFVGGWSALGELHAAFDTQTAALTGSQSTACVAMGMPWPPSPYKGSAAVSAAAGARAPQPGAQGVVASIHHAAQLQAASLQDYKGTSLDTLAAVVNHVPCSLFVAAPFPFFTSAARASPTAAAQVQQFLAQGGRPRAMPHATVSGGGPIGAPPPPLYMLLRSTSPWKVAASAAEAMRPGSLRVTQNHVAATFTATSDVNSVQNFVQVRQFVKEVIADAEKARLTRDERDIAAAQTVLGGHDLPLGGSELRGNPVACMVRLLVSAMTGACAAGSAPSARAMEQMRQDIHTFDHMVHDGIITHMDMVLRPGVCKHTVAPLQRVINATVLANQRQDCAAVQCFSLGCTLVDMATGDIGVVARVQMPATAEGEVLYTLLLPQSPDPYSTAPLQRVVAQGDAALMPPVALLRACLHAAVTMRDAADDPTDIGKRDKAGEAKLALEMTLLRCESQGRNISRITLETDRAQATRLSSAVRVCLVFIAAFSEKLVSRLGEMWLRFSTPAQRARLSIDARMRLAKNVLQVLKPAEGTPVSGEVIPHIISNAAVDSCFLLGESVLPLSSKPGSDVPSTIAQLAADARETREMFLMPRTGACMLGQPGAVRVLVGTAACVAVAELVLQTYAGNGLGVLPCGPQREQMLLRPGTTTSLEVLLGTPPEGDEAFLRAAASTPELHIMRLSGVMAQDLFDVLDMF